MEIILTTIAGIIIAILIMGFLPKIVIAAIMAFGLYRIYKSFRENK